MLTCVASALTQVVALPLLCSQASAERPAPSLQVSLARKGGLCAAQGLKTPWPGCEGSQRAGLKDSLLVY